MAGHIKPVTLDIAGQEYTFSPESTLCVVHRVATDAIYNYVQTVHEGNRLIIHDQPRLVAYLGGIIVPHTEMKDKELAKLASALDEEFGWEADVLIKDRADKETKQRYRRLAVGLFRTATTFPEEWATS